MITQYLRPALLIIAAAVAITTGLPMWNYDRTRAVLLLFVGGVCVLVALARITQVRR